MLSERPLSSQIQWIILAKNKSINRGFSISSLVKAQGLSHCYEIDNHSWFSDSEGTKIVTPMTTIKHPCLNFPAPLTNISITFLL